MSDSETSAGGLNVKRLLPIAVLVAGLVAFFAFDLDEFVTLDALKTHRTVLQGWVESQGPVAWLIYAAIYMAAVAFSVPGGSILTIAGGFMFGPFVATAVVVIGATCGATVLFLAARHAFADYLREKAGGAMRRMEGRVQREPGKLHAHPPPGAVVPVLAGQPGAGLSRGEDQDLCPEHPVRHHSRHTFVYALVGDGAGAVLDAGGDLDLAIIFEPRILAPIVGLAVLACIPIVYKRYRARRGARG